MPKAIWIICDKRICTISVQITNVEMLDRVRQPTPTSCPPPTDRQTNSLRPTALTRAHADRVGVTSNAQGNKHSAAVEPWWISKKISETIEECHVGTKMSLCYYSAEIIVSIHQIKDRKTSKEMTLRADV